MKGRSVKRTGFEFNVLRALEVFAAIVETRNITQAARLLGITQSAASQHLHSLERAFATTLLDRYARPIELTKPGIVLHQRAIRVLDEVEDLRTEMLRVESAPVPVLRVGMLASIATTLMPVISTFTRLHGIPEVACLAGLASEHSGHLRNRRADLIVTSDALYDLDGLERLNLLREQFLLVTPRGFDGPKDDLGALAARLPLVRFSAETPAGRRTDQHLRRLRLDLPRAIDADRASMVIASVHAGHGFALLSPTLLIDAVNEGMHIDIDPLPVACFHRDITVIWRARELGELAKALSALLSQALQQAISRLGTTCEQAAHFASLDEMHSGEDQP